MKNANQPRSNMRSRLASRKVLLIIAVMAIILGAGGGAALLKASDNPAFCSTCHIMKPYYQSWQQSNLLAHKHAAANVECHDCHEPSIATQMEEGVKYVTGNYQTPLEKRVFEKDFCLECHDDFEQIKAATNFEEGNPHDSHNGEQDCSVCHSMHQPSNAQCAQCHFFTWVHELDDSWTQ